MSNYTPGISAEERTRIDIAVARALAAYTVGLSSKVEELFSAQRIYRLPKISAQAWTIGVAIYWNDNTGRADTTANGPIIGAAAAATSDPSEFGFVALASPVPRTTLTDIATANATDLASAVALANATKTKINELLAALRNGAAL